MVDYRHPRRSAAPARPPAAPAAGPAVPLARGGISYDHPRRRSVLAGPGYRLRRLPDGTPQRFDPERTIEVTANVDRPAAGPCRTSSRPSGTSPRPPA